MAALLYALVAAWLAVATLATASVWYYRRGVLHPVTPSWTAPAAVIVPVRSADNLSRLLPALCDQHFPAWRLIFAVESEADPAYPILRRFIAETEPRPETDLVVAGATQGHGQKIHQQFAALARLQPRDEIVVFADADFVPRPDWLARLVHPLRHDDVDVVSGWRWATPEDDRLATLLVCAGHAAASTVPRLRAWAAASGASMAMRRRTVAELDLETVWRDALSDDLRLTRALWARGGAVLGPPMLLLRSPVGFDWRQLVAFVRRQHLMIRNHLPALWLVSAVSTTVPILGWIAAILLTWRGHPWALLGFAAAILLHQARVTMRRDVARSLWGTAHRRQVQLERWAMPAILAINAVLLWSTAFGRTIDWAGRRYRLDGRGRLRVPPEIIGG
jgi:hypothetical protein